jgi:hypothetical protein
MREIAEQRSAMRGEAFEIEHLRALGGERGDEPALARAREAAHHAQVEPRRHVLSASRTCRR